MARKKKDQSQEVIKTAPEPVVEVVDTSLSINVEECPVEAVIKSTDGSPEAPDLKPVVHYSYLLSCIVGRGAYVVPLDHPNHVKGQRVSNNVPVTTSEVVAYDRTTGVFETRNTIYKPMKVDNGPKD